MQYTLEKTQTQIKNIVIMGQLYAGKTKTNQQPPSPKKFKIKSRKLHFHSKASCFHLNR